MSNTMYYSRLIGQQFVTLKQRLGIAGLPHVPYKGSGPLKNDLLGGIYYWNTGGAITMNTLTPMSRPVARARA